MSDGVHFDPADSSGPRRTPVRMCAGCRQRSATADLVRVVAIAGTVVPDPDRRLPGRGASLHPTQQCLDRAERSRALPRALRVPGPLDLTGLREFVTRTERR